MIFYMRVLLDTNVLVSYLLTPDKKSPPYQTVKKALQQKFTLILPEELLLELSISLEEDEYLKNKITGEERYTFIEEIRSVAEVLPTIQKPIPQVTRDPKDDYLLAYAMVGRADYLVTGDKDLLSLSKVEDMNIITPHDFVKLIT